MREQINRLAKGIIEYEQSELIIPKEVVQTFSAGTAGAGELYFYREDMRELKGVIHSTNPRVVLLDEIFYGRECRVGYRVEAKAALEQVEIVGAFILATNCGEVTVPYRFTLMPERAATQKLLTLDEFTELARTDKLEALQLFSSSSFVYMPFMQQLRMRTLYDGLLSRGNHLLALEEFLTGCGAKEEVRIRVDETERNYHGINESIEDSFIIEKATWGTVRIELSCEGAFITLPVTSLTEEDFQDNIVKVRFRIKRESLHRGMNHGVIRISHIRGIHEIPITADGARTEASVNHGYMKDYTRFVRTAAAYLALDGQTELPDRESRLNGLLGEMDMILNRLRGGSHAPDQLELYHAAVQMALGRRQQAGILLEDLHDRVCENRSEELGNYCFYLYLRTEMDDDDDRRRRLVILLNKFYTETSEKDTLLWLLLRVDPILIENPMLAMSKLKERFEAGSRNPLLLIEGAKRLLENPEMLTAIDRYSSQLLWTGVRYGLTGTVLSQLTGRLATTGKNWNYALFHILKKFYADAPTTECLEGICSLLIKGEKKGKEAFIWYEKGVEQDIRLTRLYEYYLYALPEDYHRRLPRMVLMYFSYNHALNRRAQEALYANVLAYCRDDESLMEAYREQIEAFALEQMFQGVMDDRLSEIYRYAIYPEMVDEKTARVLPRLLMAKRISCDNPQISQLVLCYEELEDEQIVPLTDGKVYVPVYTENCLILLQDIYGNRYASLPYVMTDFFSDEELLAACIEKNPDYDMLSIRTCSRIMNGVPSGKITGELLLSVLRREHLRPLFVQKLQSGVIAGCRDSDETESNLYLLSLDPKLMTRQEQITVIETLIRKESYRDAYAWLTTWGHEGVAPEYLLALCRRMVRDKGFEPDARLLSLCADCLKAEQYDPYVMEYLCRFFNGSCSQMKALLMQVTEQEKNVFDLPERLLGQMLFTGWHEGLDEVFFAYVSKGTADEMLVRAYLVTKCFLYFTEDEAVTEDVFAYLEQMIMSRDVANGMPNVCLMALSKHYSTKESLSERQKEICREMVAELYRQDYVFAYYQKLSEMIALPGGISGKLIIEYRGKKNSRIKLRMRVSACGEEVTEELIPHVYEGYYVKAVTVFVGETVDYEIYDSEKGDAPVKSGRIMKSCVINKEDKSRESQLNQILAELSGDRDDLYRCLEQYGAEDTLSKQLFTIR